MSRTNQLSPTDHLINFMFHFGKATWKSIPFIGPFVDELIYEQFKSSLTRKIEKFSPEQVEQLKESLPDIDIEKVTELISSNADSIKEFTSEQIKELLTYISDSHSTTQEKLDELLLNTEVLPDIVGMINTLKANVNDSSRLNEIIKAYEIKRKNWIKRISNNQKRLLEEISSEEYLPVDDIWQIAWKLMPNCSYKEFRFRLHEFEWLGLVNRYWENETWYYKQIR